MPCYYPIQLKDMEDKVPCGRCIGCRLERSKQWAIRCMNEAQMHDENCFITLTYRQDKLVYGGNETGTLYPRHLELFWKRLRKEYGNGIRYFACGEYGGEYYRPHYHAAIFGFDFTDKKFLKVTPNGDNLYTSDSLDCIWGNGNCIIGALTFESAAYVARYIVGKKLGKEGDYYKHQGLCSEFVRMSRRPGIGASWYERFVADLYPHGYQIVRNGIKSNVPKYYSRKFQAQNPKEMAMIKNRRKEEMDLKWREFVPKRLAVAERVKRAQIKSLKRDLE